MTWAKLSDDYADDCWTFTDAAFRLHTEALVWNGRKLLDCRIPKGDIRRFAKHPESVAELLAAGWWTEAGDCYVIRHHADYQRTKAQELARQSANTANGRKGGRPAKPREQASDLTPKTHSVTEPLSESLSQTKTQRDGIRTRTGQAVNASPPTTKENNVGNCSRCGHREPLDDAGTCGCGEPVEVAS